MPNLILSRRAGESFTIGDDITITVVENNPGEVRIAIQAPREKVILRSEIAKRPDKPNSPSAAPVVQHKHRKKKIVPEDSTMD